MVIYEALFTYFDDVAAEYGVIELEMARLNLRHSFDVVNYGRTLCLREFQDF
jgi:hypothetical protein